MRVCRGVSNEKLSDEIYIVFTLRGVSQLGNFDVRMVTSSLLPQ